ncbi:B12-binding domain-containing radical SAM protein [Gammaproteobacteria bacterium]|nr:B12-binding domain-containing radical SAM protein [Gammaproteobacteria bacterium]
MVDILFVNPGNAAAIYQNLADNFSAIEPPTWALLLAESVRARGFVPAILDVNAERLPIVQTVERIREISPRLICFVVYGQNPNSGTVNMSGTVELAEAIKADGIAIPVAAVGSHISALPREVLDTELAIDVILCNEGVYALRNLLSSDLENPSKWSEINGIGFRLEGKSVFTPPEVIVPQDRMDLDLPGYAWDLLPYREKPLDLYRSHFWHAGYDHARRTPFAAIYTSLGCTFRCSFCMINILNRDNDAEIGVASDYAKMRFWSPELIIGEIDKLVDMGVQTLRISDEMFLLNKRYFVPLCEMLRDRGYGEKLNMWAYSRVDTVRDQSHLDLVKSAGINWLALGIESGNQKVRLEVTKGRFQDVDIRKVIQMIEASGIEVIANYLFGLPGDNTDSMQETLDLSLELCTAAWNGYAVMALPGSELYFKAREQGHSLPSDYTGYSFHSYDTLPLPTDQLSPAEVLEFRDRAFVAYHSHPEFIAKLRNRFGQVAVDNLQELTKVKLRRKILEAPT